MNSRLSVYLIVFFVSMPLQYFSFEIYSNKIRDNNNYSTYYDGISPFFSFGEMVSDYFLYVKAVGAREPIYFIYSEFMAKIGVDYTFSIAFLNFVFLFSIAYALDKFKLKSYFFALFVFYLTFDYYVFSLSSEIHRLKVGVIFFIFSICQLRSGWGRLFFSILMILSHFQMLLMLPLLYSLGKILKKYFLFFVILFFLVSPYLISKIKYYIVGGTDVLISMLYISVDFLLFVVVFPFLVSDFRLHKKYVLWIFSVFFIIALVGQERINIFVFEVGFFYFLYLSAVRMQKNSQKLGVCFLFFYVVFLSIYNFSKVYVQYNFLVSS